MTHTMIQKEKVFFPNLDTLRFFAFFLVFWQHAFAICFKELYKIFNKNIVDGILVTGGEGVKVFFVLSGFLITYLLMKEGEKNNKINILFFYARRLLRIWPLYFLIILTSIFILPRISEIFVYCGSKPLDMCFLSNFDLMHRLLYNGCQMPYLDISWSVSIEEQFYIMWPLLFSLIFRKKNLFVFTCFAIIIGSYIYIYTANNIEVAYFNTLGNIAFLLIGCLGAFIIFKDKKKLIVNFILKNFKYLFLVFATFFICRNISIFKYISSIILPVGYLIAIIYFAFSQTTILNRMSSFRKLGKYTYGLYFYHYLVLIIIKIVFDKMSLDYLNNIIISLLLAVFSLAITILVSYLSYQYFEKMFLKLKNKFTIIKSH